MRRVFIALVMTLIIAGPVWAETLPKMTVWKSPTCGCCDDWVTHMREAGFEVTVIETDDVDQLKDLYKVPDRLRSCHTARVGDYVVEGHVPADDVKAMLSQKPTISGISVPGMPVGSPGMEMGDQRDPFFVVSYDRDGNMRVRKAYRTGYR